MIALVPDASSLAYPLEFRRNRGFSITSNIQLKCNDSSGIITQWTIRACNSTCSIQIHVDPTIVTTFTEIYIPAKTLPYGIYQFILTVSMAFSPNLSSSNSTYLKIVPSNITVNLMMYGASMISRGYTQNLVFDPGQYSVDPDEDTFNATVSDSVNCSSSE